MTENEIVKYAQLDLLIELKRICEKNSINYFLVGGTLIGAIRHNGFIPWDDDIDVGMLRDDYEKFIKVCSNELDDQYKLYDWNIDKKSPLPFLKMKIKETHYREELSKDTEMNDEIFIDIFPFDNAPDSKIGQFFHSFKNVNYRKLLLLKCGFTIDMNAGGIKKLAYIGLRLLSKFYGIASLKRKHEKNAKKYNKKKTELCVNLCGAYSYTKEIKRMEVLFPLTEHVFEEYVFSVPGEYDRYLREIYGDYMVLPPESKRTGRHGVSLIDMGSYVVKNRK